MEVLEAIQKRRTVRIPFNKKRVSEEDIGIMLEVSNISPNGDPISWRLARIEDDAIKSKLVQIVKEDFGDSFQRNTQKFREVFSQYPKWLRFQEAKDGIILNQTPKAAEHFLKLALGKTLGPLFGKLGVMNQEVKAYCKNILSAPVVFGVFIDKRIEANQSGMPSIWNTGAMLQNLRLAATSLGLCYQDLGWITATENGAEKVRLLLNVPEEYIAVNFFRIGYADNLDNQPKKSDFRRDLRDIVHFGEFGSKNFSVLPIQTTSVKVFDSIRGKKAEHASNSISGQKLGYLLEAARWAPTGFNVQPFEFLVIDQERGESIMVIEDRDRSDPDPGPCEALARGGVLQNIRLAARALGVDSEIEKPTVAEEENVRRTLCIPQNYSIVAWVKLKGGVESPSHTPTV